MGLVRACDLSELEEDEIFKAEIDGHPPIAIFRIGEHVFATADTCTHGEASLADDGYVEDGRVICTWHDGAFDIRTGVACRLPCMDPIATYKTEIKDGAVFVDIEGR